MHKKKYFLFNLHCLDCATKIKNCLEQNHYIKEVNIDFVKNNLFIIYQDKNKILNIKELKKIINKIDNNIIIYDNNFYEKIKLFFNKKSLFILCRILLSFLFFFLSSCLLKNQKIINYLYFFALLIISYDIFYSFFKKILTLQFKIDENFLIIYIILETIFSYFNAIDYYHLYLENIITIALFQIGKVMKLIIINKFKNLFLSKNNEINYIDDKNDNFIIKFTNIFIILIIFFSIIFALYFGFFTKDWHLAIKKIFELIIIFCPCSIFISIPFIYFANIMNAFEKKIYIKNTNCLKKLLFFKKIICYQINFNLQQMNYLNLKFLSTEKNSKQNIYLNKIIDSKNKNIIIISDNINYLPKNNENNINILINNNNNNFNNSIDIIINNLNQIFDIKKIIEKINFQIYFCTIIALIIKICAVINIIFNNFNSIFTVLAHNWLAILMILIIIILNKVNKNNKII